MEYHGRRNRRGRCRSRQNPPPIHDYTPPQAAKPWCFLSGVYSLLIMTSLIAVVYMMLEYHCETCKTHYDINEITRNIDVIAKNLSVIVHNYYDLETKISKLSCDLPKIEGQMEMLEALAHSLETKTDINLPKIDILSNFNLPKIDIVTNFSTEREANTSIMDNNMDTRLIPIIVEDRFD